MSDDKKEEFDFIKEKIKEKPIDKKRLLNKSFFTVVLAVVFGFVACLVFTVMQPVMNDWFNKPESTRVNIPRDEEVVSTETETEAEMENTEEEPVTETEVPLDISVEDYQKLQNKLYSIGSQANKSVVTVTGVKSDMDWFSTPYESEGQASGMIVANNGIELLIMTEKKVITDAMSIRVTFINDVTADATLKKYDGNTGIAILSVPLTAIDEMTMNRIEVATLGNSLQTSQGSTVIAVGRPLGTNYSILTGNITSTGNIISTYDANYSILTTNIVGSSKGNGVLVNLSGEIVGIVMQDFSNEGDENTLTAVSISQLKDVIERLSNNQDVAYLGLKISTVTSVIADEYDIPQGVYIKSVAIDSPALAAGLQSGDVITEIDGESIVTVQTYKNTIMALNPEKQIDITFKRQGTSGYTKMECQATLGILK